MSTNTSSFIDISKIFKKHYAVLNLGENKLNRKLFIYLPLFIGAICAGIFFNWTASVLNVITVVLSIFVPLFMNLLVLLITTLVNKVRTRHNEDRVDLIKEIFYNICFLIPASLILICNLLLLELKPFEDVCVCILTLVDVELSFYDFYLLFFSFVFYSGLAHLFVTILMITKRIFRLFDIEIGLLSQQSNDKKED